MKKKLKTNGHKINAYQVRVIPLLDKSGEKYEKISLSVVAEGLSYSYDIHNDERHPNLTNIKSYLESSFAKSISDYLNVEISEYKERHYLYIDFQGIGTVQYTGRRTA